MDLRETVGRFLRESYGDVPEDPEGDFVVDRNDVTAWVRLRSLARDQTAVFIWTISNADMRVDADLTRFLATEGRNLAFGQFELYEETPRVHISHALLGEFLSREELKVAVDAVCWASSHYGPIVKDRFGGRLGSEVPAALSGSLTELADVLAEAHGSDMPTHSPHDVGDRQVARTGVLRAVFMFLGLVAAVVASIAAYQETSSWFLVAYVFPVTCYVIAGALVDVVTHAHRIRRAVYVALPPCVSIGCLYLAHRWWDRWWLAAILGLAGWLIGRRLGAALFPAIAREERLDIESGLRMSG